MIFYHQKTTGRGICMSNPNAPWDWNIDLDLPSNLSQIFLEHAAQHLRGTTDATPFRSESGGITS